MRRTLAAALVIDFLIGALLAPAAVAAATATTVVKCGAGADLQAAIDAALPGATLTVRGTCVGNFVVRQDLTLVGGARAELDAQGSGTTLTISYAPLGAKHVSITGVTITGGDVGVYAAGEQGSSLMLLRSEVSGNGVGIKSARDTVTLRNSTVKGNSAGGIGIQSLSVVRLYDSTVSANTGFGIKAGGQGHAFISSSKVSANIGTGIVVGDAGVTLDDSTVRGNTAGGISLFAGPLSTFLDVRHSTIAANSVADYGGGIYIGADSSRASITIEDSTIRANTAGISGGGIYKGSGVPPITLTNVKFRNNTPDDCFGC